MRVKAIDKTRLPATIVHRIEESIRWGELEPGQPIPAERQLSDQLGVSRSSLREAIRILEHAGVLEVRSGSGTFVTPDALSRATTMRAQAALDGEESPLDIMVARRAIEPVCAHHAALHRRASDLKLLVERLEKHRSVIEGTRSEVAEANLGFHSALVMATHNPVLINLSERLEEIMDRGAWHVMKLRLPGHQGSDVDLTKRYVREHEVILDAVKRSDAEAAEAAVSAHLDSIEKQMFAFLPVESAELADTATGNGQPTD